ncbi:alpha/beta fold hydrolase [Saccharopolyspora sp. HNM0983]|uniref:Alpha/beta fold hydrolase n=1 Tax=Saccharopolyspora montiporae TaxID=2781240 RepID=A0A929B5Y0_9PSEU|nr:alpha/beta fold hydrolase [Saccharopolyspora sp. HNM0983]MBE9373814.1 alpha/beta fold hydrolase [Saccharopolyspora sp. HNM0983]
MAFLWGMRTLVAAAAAAPLAFAGLPAAAADIPDKTADILLVHGFGSDCSALNAAKDHFQEQVHVGAVKTVGYRGTDDCDVDLPASDNDTPIQEVAADLAHYVDDHYSSVRPVNIVGHSMGGLVTRVALLGSAQEWTEPDFPDGKLPVNNVVTLGTPHQGIADPDQHDAGQWEQMRPHSGFMKRLRADGNGLDADWAAGTDWTLVGSAEDKTVTYTSAIDEGNRADKKFGYQDDPEDADAVTHDGLRTIGEGAFSLRYWEKGEPTQETENGWAPLETAYNAATHLDDDLPS